jgi:predicted nucleic acid-binding protein
MAIVVDTNVVSFVFKKDTRNALYQPHLDGEFMILSFMTLAELHLWSLASNWGAKRKADFEKHLRRYSIQHSTPELCQIWAEITDGGRRIGKSIAVADARIAATALLFDVPLVTHNAADFKAVQNLKIITES